MIGCCTTGISYIHVPFFEALCLFYLDFIDFLISSFFYFAPSLRHSRERTFTDVKIASKRCIDVLLTSFRGSVPIGKLCFIIYDDRKRFPGICNLIIMHNISKACYFTDFFMWTARFSHWMANLLQLRTVNERKSSYICSWKSNKQNSRWLLELKYNFLNFQTLNFCL